MEVGHDAEANMATVTGSDKLHSTSNEMENVQYINESGEPATVYSCIFDLIHVCLNGEMLSEKESYVSVIINAKTFFNVSQIALKCGIELKTEEMDLTGGYVVFDGDYYLPTFNFCNVIPATDFDINENSGEHTLYLTVKDNF